MCLRKIAASTGVTVVLLFSTAVAAQTYCEAGNGPLRTDPLEKSSLENTIRRFAENESRSKHAIADYTFTEDLHIQTLSGMTPRGTPIIDGELKQTTDVSFDRQGRRLEHVTYAPPSTLRRVSLMPQDLQDIHDIMMFAITTEELPSYNISYVGQQHIDELDSYVFDVAPKALEKGKRYFEGKIWVDSRDLAVVKTCGKSVPDIQHAKGEENMTPKFVTYREQFSGYWFPTYVRSDDFLFFRQGAIRIREIVKNSNYKQRTVQDSASGH